MVCDDSTGAAGEGPRPGHSGTVLAIAMVIVPDQVSKWWAWREVAHARINFGGDPFVGPIVDGWYADPVTGAVLDFLGAGILVTAAIILLHHRHPVLLRATAALAIGGWISNLLDRLGMHHLTAPGSVRGAIDFVHIGRYYLNLADFFIVGATLVFLAAHAHRWVTTRLSRSRATTRRIRFRPRVPARIAAVTGAAALVTAVTLGATNYGGVTGPLPPARMSAYR